MTKWFCFYTQLMSFMQSFGAEMQKLQVDFKTKLQGLVLHIFSQEEDKTIQSPILISQNDDGIEIDLNLLQLGQNCLLVVQNDGTQNGIVQCGIRSDKEQFCEIKFELKSDIKYHEVCSFFIKNDEIQGKANKRPMVLATNYEYQSEIDSANVTRIMI